jgi:two-component system sensor histidine kinase CpxA
MGVRGNLFVKTFVGFWLATIAILLSWMLSSHYFDTRHGEDQAAVRESFPAHTGPPPRFMLRTLYNLQHLPEAGVRDLVAELKARHGVDVFLLREDGSELLDREVPRPVSRLAAKLGKQQRRLVEGVRGKHLAGHLLHRDDEGLVRAVFVIPRPARGLLRALGDNLWLRIALAVLVSGMVCFLLSRLMTNRLKELGRASRRLAQGDLDTRLRVRDRGGDETDELARDFNTMAAQLQDRINEQKRLISDVSHELRSPLARLRVALALAEEDAAHLPSHLARIGRETDRLDQLIDQLLSAGEDSLTLDSHIDLIALLRQLCADTGFEGRSRNVSVRFDTVLDQAVVASASDLLHRCFDNLLRNALAHSPAGGEIRVGLRQEPGAYTVAIVDQGPGVPPDELERIFNEFYRVDVARSRESGGYGLGLAIARRAVQRHGGTIRAENISQGLRVTVTLPRDGD